MMDLQGLFKTRFKLWTKEIGKYSRLILNDHFSVVIMVILGFGVLYYRELLMTLQHQVVQNRLQYIMIGVVSLCALTSTFGYPIWLMKEADEAYLIGLGEKWRKYWIKGSLLGLIVPIVLNAVLMTVLYPIVATIYHWENGQYFISWIICQMLMVIAYHMNYFLMIFQLGIRRFWLIQVIYAGILGVSLSHLVPLRWDMIVGVSVISLIAYQLVKTTKISQQTVHFHYVVSVDRQRQDQFYRLVRFFADTPHEISEVAPVQWFDFLLRLLPFSGKEQQFYLYMRVVLRNRHYSGIWIRVSIFIAILLFWADNMWLIALLGIIGLFLTLVQLLPIVDRYRFHPMEALYPSKWHKTDKQVMQYVMKYLLFFQMSYFFIIILMRQIENWKNYLVIVLFWIATVLLMIFGYIPYWFKRRENK